MAPRKPKSVTVQWLQRNVLANQATVDSFPDLMFLQEHILKLEETIPAVSPLLNQLPKIDLGLIDTPLSSGQQPQFPRGLEDFRLDRG